MMLPQFLLEVLTYLVLTSFHPPYSSPRCHCADACTLSGHARTAGQDCGFGNQPTGIGVRLEHVCRHDCERLPTVGEGTEASTWLRKMLQF